MKAMILAAGRGERLRPLTDRIPKPLLPIAGEALIVHQLGWLRRAGIIDIVVNLHQIHRSEVTDAVITVVLLGIILSELIAPASTRRLLGRVQ